MLPVVVFELQALSTAMADKLWKRAQAAFLGADLTAKPQGIKVDGVGGLLEVWVTHAADNFSVQ